MSRPRTVLICHHDAPLHEDGMARWLASWSDLSGIVVIEEPRRMVRKRLRRELARVGLFRLLDVLAMRVYYRLVHAAKDAAWIDRQRAQLRDRYPVLPAATPVVRVSTPSATASQQLIEAARPDLTIALCKSLLAERIFSVPTRGTIVLHPGICPEYRNAHGCFWALASGDVDNVGMTLLRIDRGIDTGPVFGYFRANVDEVHESHIVIQHRMTLDNLDAIKSLLLSICAGDATPIDTRGRASHEWGQPWLSRYLAWKRRARARQP